MGVKNIRKGKFRLCLDKGHAARRVRIKTQCSACGESAFFAGAWGVPNKQGSVRLAHGADKEYPKGYSLSLLARVIGTFQTILSGRNPYFFAKNGNKIIIVLKTTHFSNGIDR